MVPCSKQRTECLDAHPCLELYCLHTDKNFVLPTSENVPLDICIQGRLKSACAFAQSVQNLHWTHFRKPRMQNFFTRTINFNQTARKRRLTASSLGANARRFVFSCCCLILFRINTMSSKHNDSSLRKHAYSNILKILPPKE